MDFQGQGRALTKKGLKDACASVGAGEPEIWAVLNVETRGFGFFPDRRPQILFERHIFSQLTGRKLDSRNPDLSSKYPGGYAGGTAEYGRLKKAMTLDAEAALQSASWGIGQVMGFNYRIAGYDSVTAMIQEMVEDEDAQLRAMSHFIRNNHLARALNHHDWTGFARGYNGKDFARNDYDARLAAAHAKFKAMLPDLNLRRAQAALNYLGFTPGPIDGLRGRLTASALIRFQQKHRLPATGDLDRATRSRLVALAWPK